MFSETFQREDFFSDVFSFYSEAVRFGKGLLLSFLLCEDSHDNFALFVRSNSTCTEPYTVHEHSGYKLSGKVEYTWKMRNHNGMHGQKRFPEALVTKQNTRKNEHVKKHVYRPFYSKKCQDSFADVVNGVH